MGGINCARCAESLSINRNVISVDACTGCTGSCTASQSSCPYSYSNRRCHRQRTARRKAGQAGNLTDETSRATRNADLQRNNVQWLDANGDGVQGKSAPAFATIKLWVDINSDGVMQAGEGQDLDVYQLAANDRFWRTYA